MMTHVMVKEGFVQTSSTYCNTKVSPTAWLRIESKRVVTLSLLQRLGTPQRSVFYQAILNVPLYLWTNESNETLLLSIENMAKRSKFCILIRWEKFFLNLDPQEHRSNIASSGSVEHHSIAALFSLHELSNSQHYILRYDGGYYLRNPNYSGSEVDVTSDDWDFLGNSMSESIEQLPVTLQERSVRYVEYQQILHAVLNGLTPHVLQKIVAFPFKWRQSYDDLRAQYGDHPTPEHQDLLRDFKDITICSRMHYQNYWLPFVTK